MKPSATRDQKGSGRKLTIILLSIVIIPILAVLGAGVMGILYLHQTSLRERAYLLETPVNVSRSQGALFPIIFDGHTLTGPSFHGMFTHMGVSKNVIVWTDTISSSPGLSMYDGQTGVVYHAATKDELIETAKQVLSVDITEAFPLRQPETYVRQEGELHLFMSINKYAAYERKFLEALKMAREKGASAASGVVSDPRNRPILCEEVEDGAAIRMWSTLANGTQRISVTAYLNRPDSSGDAWEDDVVFPPQ